MKISLEYVDPWPKIYLILYLSIGNMKTQVAIARGTLLSNNDEKKFKHSLQMKRKLLLLHSFIRIILSFDEKKKYFGAKIFNILVVPYTYTVLQICLQPLGYLWSKITTIPMKIHSSYWPENKWHKWEGFDFNVFNLKQIQNNWKIRGCHFKLKI